MNEQEAWRESQKPEGSSQARSDLSASENDASELGNSAQSVGHAIELLLTQQQTRAAMMIREWAERLRLPRFIEATTEAAFKQVVESDVFIGKSQNAQVAAALYFACRKDNIPYIYMVSHVPIRRISHCYLLLTRSTDLKQDTSVSMIPRLCRRLGLSGQVQKAGIHIAEKVVELSIASRHRPSSIASAAIFMASQASASKRTSSEVGNAARVAATTVRQTYSLLLPRARELFPSNFIFFTSISRLPLI